DRRSACLLHIHQPPQPDKPRERRGPDVDPDRLAELRRTYDKARAQHELDAPDVTDWDYGIGGTLNYAESILDQLRMMSEGRVAPEQVRNLQRQLEIIGSPQAMLDEVRDRIAAASSNLDSREAG